MAKQWTPPATDEIVKETKSTWTPPETDSIIQKKNSSTTAVKSGSTPSKIGGGQDLNSLIGTPKAAPLEPTVLTEKGLQTYSTEPRKEKGYSYTALVKGLQDLKVKQPKLNPSKTQQDFADPRLSEMWRQTHKTTSADNDAILRGVNALFDYAAEKTPQRVKNAWTRGEIQGEIAGLLPLQSAPTEENIREIARYNQLSESIPQSQEAKEFNEGGLKWLFSNPGKGAKFLGEVILESLSAQLKASERTTATAVSMGATAGTVVPGVGTGAGAFAGFTAGQVLAGMNLETSGKILEVLKDAGFDTKDEDQLVMAFSDKRLMDKARDLAIKRGVPIAVLDLLTAGLGGRIASRTTRTLGGKIGKTLGAAGVEAAGGSTGEAVAQVASGEDFNLNSVALEGIAELGAGAPALVSETAGNIKDRNKTSSSNSNIVKQIVADRETGVVEAKQNLDRQLEDGLISPEQYQEGQTVVDRVVSVDEKIPETVEGEVREQSIQLITKRDDLNNEIKELEESKKSIDEAYHEPILKKIESRKEKVEGLNTEIKALAKTKPEETVGETSQEVAENKSPASQQQEATTEMQGIGDGSLEMSSEMSKANQKEADLDIIKSTANTISEKAKSAVDAIEKKFSGVGYKGYSDDTLASTAAIELEKELPSNVYFHGTDTEIDQIDLNKVGKRDFGNIGSGFYISKSPRMSQAYAEEATKKSGKDPLLKSIIVNSDNFIDANEASEIAKKELGITFPTKSKEEATKVRELIIGLGYDGVVLADGKEIAVFNPKVVQIGQTYNGLKDLLGINKASNEQAPTPTEATEQVLPKQGEPQAEGVTIEQDDTVSNDTVSGEVDTLTDTLIDTEEVQLKKRAATQRVLSSDEYSQEFKSALSDKAIYYKELPNTVTEKEAEAFIEIKGIAEAELAISDFNNGMSSAVRFSVMQKMIDSYEANGEYLKAAELAEDLYSKATDYGQGIQIFSTFPKLSKASNVAIAKKNVEAQRDKKRKDAAPKTKKITDGFKKANKEAAEEAVERVKKTIEKVMVVTPEGKIAELPSTYGARNKVFTRERYLLAKKNLRGKSMAFAGAVPIEDLINIAGYHLEATGRDFNKFTRRMKADLGGKIKPYLKEIYGKTRESLISENYDPALFLTDEEIDSQINEQEGQVFKEKLEKAIQRKDAKEQKQAIAKLQEISKDEGLWGQYSASAAAKLKGMVLTNVIKDIEGDPSLQQFTDGLVKNMRAKMVELLPEQPKKGTVLRPDIEIIGDAYKNFEKYKEVWEKTQIEFQEKYAEQPEILESIDAYFGEILDKPFSEKILDRAISKGLKDMDKNIANLVVQHYTVLDSARQSLSDKLVYEAGLTGSEATSLANAIQEQFDKIATKKKQEILEKIFSSKERKKPEVKSLEGDIIKMSNLGAFRDGDIIEMYGDKMGWPTLSEENIKEIERLSDIVQKTTDPIKKRRAVEDLLSYQAMIKGSSVTDLVTSIWYANVLSGYNTQIVNFGANAINTVLLYANAVAQRPKDAVFIAKGLVEGIKRGLLEGKETINTGYSPIKGKAEVPSLLERETFTGLASPLRYAKYVRRIMVAADVIFFEGQKEMRAYQLAKRQAAKESRENPTIKELDRAIEIVGKSNGQLDAIREKVELELEQEIKSVQESELTEKEKASKIKQLQADKKRHIFDLVEQQRSGEMIEGTAEYAATGTYNYPPKGVLGVVANAINTVVDKVPALRVIVPFTNIIANVANETIHYTPIGALMGKRGGFSRFRMENELTDQQRADLYTKAAIGTTLMITAAVLSNVKDEDDESLLEITSNGTGDYAKNETLKKTGWQPYSIRVKINGEYTGWISYQYTPLIAVLGIVGHYNDLVKYKEEKDEDTIATRLSKAAGLTVSSFFQATYLEGLNKFLQAVSDPRSSEATIEKAVKSTLGLAKGVIIPNLYSQSAQELQRIFNMPKKEVRQTIMGSVLQDIPYARSMYFNKVNILGDEILPDTDKFHSGNKPDKLIQLLIDKKAVFAPMNRKTEKIYDMELDRERSLTGEEFYKYSKLKGQEIKTMLDDDYKYLSGLDEKDFKKELTKIKKMATKNAKYELAGIIEDSDSEEED